MKTRFKKGYINELTFGNLSSTDKELLEKRGYKEDKQGEVTVSFKFGDGIAFVPNGCGLVLRYPTLAEVRQSEQMQKELADCIKHDDIIPYDVALKYGRLGEYKYVLDYPTWSEEDDNCNKEIYAINTENDGELHHCFDAFEEDFLAIDAQDYLKDDGGTYTLRDGLSSEDIERLQANYGILWTEWISNHVFNEKRQLEKVD